METQNRAFLRKNRGVNSYLARLHYYTFLSYFFMRTRKWLKRLSVLTGIVLALLLFNDYMMSFNASERLFDQWKKVPHREVGLLLGTSPRTADGRANLYFRYRINAAASLYHSGRVRHLLVSGDNHEKSYNEPAYMRAALLRKGVPARAITLDYAGFRTLDSVVRCLRVFEQRSVTVISQRFHNERALFLCDAFGLDAIAFNAHGVRLSSDFKTRLREVLARAKALLDVYVLETQPHFLGNPEPIVL